MRKEDVDANKNGYGDIDQERHSNKNSDAVFDANADTIVNVNKYTEQDRQSNKNKGPLF